MSTRLDLPPERDLPETRRREIRAELVRATRPSRRRPQAWRAWRVLAPLALVALAVAVVLGLTQPWVLTPPVVGVPSRPPSAVPSSTQGPLSVPAPTPAIPSAGPPVFPQGKLIDRGPLRGAARTKAVEACTSGLGRQTSVAEMHLARRTSTDGDVVIFTGRDGLSYLCSDNGGSLYAGSGSKTSPLPDPTRRRPVIRIMDAGARSSGGSQGRGGTATSTGYRVGPEVVSLQLRLTVAGHPGAWFEASLDDGYAWGAASIDRVLPPRKRLTDQGDYTVDDRAFDAEGHELAIDRTPR